MCSDIWAKKMQAASTEKSVRGTENFRFHKILFLNFSLYISVKLMFAVSIFITYALQYYVPLNIIWPHIERRVMEATYYRRLALQYVFRTVLVLLSCKFTNQINLILGVQM